MTTTGTSTAAPTRTTPTGRVAAFTRPWLTWGSFLLLLTSVSQVIASRGDEDKADRDAWLSDLAFVLIASALFGAVSYAVARRGLRGPEQRENRTVVGLTVSAVVLSVIGWFTAAPHLAALAALQLSRVTGARERSTAARTCTVISFVVIVGLLLFTTSTLIAEDLL